MMKRSVERKILAGLTGTALVMETLFSFGGAAQASETQSVYTAPGEKPISSEAEENQAQVEKKEEPVRISINLAARSLALYRGSEKVALYPIGPGTATTPTPTGYYKVQEKIVNPTWTSPSTGESIASGPDNPLGYRWIGFQGNYGIHGTNHPDSVGHYVSNGCVRMHEEDVEKVFDKVEVGTPIEITYNRVVVEKIPDQTIVYYIYPDGYGRQNLDVADVASWLKGYGVADFESDEAIQQKIDASDGQPTYIAKVYPLIVNGQKLKEKAVVQDGITYLPSISLAKASKVSLGWNADSNTLVSTVGKAVGYNKKDTLYCNADDAETLFHLTGGLNKSGAYELKDDGQGNAPAETKTQKKEKTLQEIQTEATKKG